MDKDTVWRTKLKELTNALGPIGNALYAEIEDAVDERIYQAKDDAYDEGWRNGQDSCMMNHEYMSS